MEQGDLEKDLDTLDLESVSVRSKQNLQELVWALVYGCGEAKLRAAYEIGMLTKSSAKRRAYLAAAGAITPLVSMLSSSSMEAQDASMQALLNLAVRHERNKVKIVKAGAVPVLVKLLQSESANLRESAAAVILTLSASNANKPIIGSSDATALLVDMLMCGSIQGRVDAVMALYNLSTYPDNLMPILTAGAISPLILLLKDCRKASKVAEKTTALLQSLMVFEEARSAIASEEGGVLTLVEVLEEGSLQSREHACKGPLERDRKRKTFCSFLEIRLSHRESAGSVNAKKMLTDMVQLSMEQSMRHLQQRAMTSLPATPRSRSTRATNKASN
ncbi:hypothetical protein GOP47_0018796 [Adiantum capillus-veneris]|uniref:U-box domain-containing protein 4 n=1 Tax=Adiantum capillus-veneris TaxID=13818 RepID=A0A9D4Z9Y8_ADICA|nr:hypothetical protein GOP47_0018796 [Adiantum capillus-veneris]